MAFQSLPASAVNEDANQELSSLSGKPMKKHEKWGLKGIAKEQHAGYWEQVEYWCKERFSEAKWREVVRRIERAAKEDNLVMLGWHTPRQPFHYDNAQALRWQLLRGSSSLMSSTGTHSLHPIHLPHTHTSTPTTARPRWDIVNSGPVTPLSATSSIKNAFAEGGVWASLSPKTPTSPASDPHTPIAAVLAEAWTPESLRDSEAKAIYDKIRREVKQTALRVCAKRLGLHRSSASGQDVIHPSMVKPKDELIAVEMDLDTLQIDLFQVMDTTIRDRMEQFADDEAGYLRQYSIPTAETLSDIDSWLHIDGNTGEMTTILEAQRDLLRMLRNLRKEQEVDLCDKAVQCAWAVKILCDLEYTVDNRADIESVDSEEGYSYENFLRNIRSQSRTVTETSGPSSPIDTTTRFRGNDVKQTFTRHSSSPVKRTLSSFSLTASPSRRPYPHRRTVSINTSSPSRHIEPPKLSPEERFYRHQGPSMADLDSWADELKNMRHMRSEANLNAILHLPMPSGPSLLSPSRKREDFCRKNSADDTMSWLRETADSIEDTGGTMLRLFLNENVGIEEYGGEDIPTPRIPLRLDPPGRPTHMVQRDDESIRRQAALEYRQACRKVNRTVGYKRSVSGQRDQEEVQEWARELERMESREKLRQLESYFM